MLVLKRKEGQSIDVGDNVRIVLREIRGKHVKVGILAPKEIRVKRSEIALSVAEENVKAVRSSSRSDETLQDLVQILGSEQAEKGE